MRKQLITAGVVVLAIAGIGVFNRYFEPSRLSAAQLEQQREAAAKLEEAQAAEIRAQIADARASEAEASQAAAEETQESPAASEAAPAAAAAEEAEASDPPAEETGEAEEETTEMDEAVEWPEEAPDTFKVRFEASNGTFVVQVDKAQAPLGAQRFYDLVRKEFFDEARFFRVIPGFVVQFGLPGDPEVAREWRTRVIPDDPVRTSNRPGTMTFATAGPNTRTTQLFINLGNNANLDGMGFAPFAEVVEGFEVVQGINAAHGERPNQGAIQSRGNDYLMENYPDLDFIRSARLVK